MINFGMLAKEITEHGHTLNGVSHGTGISEKKLNEKLQGKKEFDVGEVMKIVNFLGLDGDTATLIFFDLSHDDVPTEVRKWAEYRRMGRKSGVV